VPVVVAANAKLIAVKDSIVNNVLSFFMLSSPRGCGPLCLDSMEREVQAQGYKGNEDQKRLQSSSRSSFHYRTVAMDGEVSRF